MTLDPALTSDLVFLHCPSCERECPAEIPPCADGHGNHCPDRACLECGAALLVDAQLAAPRQPSRRAA